MLNKRKMFILALAITAIFATACGVDKRLVGNWSTLDGKEGFTFEADMRGYVDIQGTKVPMVYMLKGNSLYVSYMDPVLISDLEFKSNATSEIRNYINSDTERVEYIISFFGSYEFVLEHPIGSGNTAHFYKLADEQ